MNKLLSWIHYSMVSVLFISTMVLYLFLFGDQLLYASSAIVIFLIALSRAINLRSRKRMRAGLIVVYIALLGPVLIALNSVVFNVEYQGVIGLFARAGGIVLVFSPLIIEHLTTVTNPMVFAIPSLSEAGVLSFAQLARSAERIRSVQSTVDKLSTTLSTRNLKEIISDLPRHNSTSYINNGSLNADYFARARESMADPYVYIVVSNTGSAASELISVFTRKQFNHVSIAFDSKLETIISYNGGEKVYPPGMNAEMLEFFNKKPDASVGVYRLHAGYDKKQQLIQTIEKINNEGSAYNLMGLIFKYSHRPNIMFCSQFVYTLLQSVDLHYFDKKPEYVKPTDLVELDYTRKLEFVGLLTFSE